MISAKKLMNQYTGTKHKTILNRVLNASGRTDKSRKELKGEEDD